MSDKFGVSATSDYDWIGGCDEVAILQVAYPWKQIVNSLYMTHIPFLYKQSIVAKLLNSPIVPLILLDILLLHCH